MNRRGIATVSAAVTLLLAVSGCAGSGPSGPEPAPPARADVVRVDAPALASPAADQRTTAGLSGQLGLALLRELAAEGHTGTLAVSPASLEGALAMLLPGARGATADEIRSLLGTSLTGERYAAALGALRRAETTRAAQDHDQLSFADDLWLQQGFHLQDSYLRTLAGAFGTGAYTTDFAGNPDGAASAINARVAQETHGMIPTLFDPGALGPNTRLVLTDALYLHADWAAPFDASRTQPAPFHLADGTTAQVPTMTGDAPVAAGATADWRIAELPYVGGHLAMDLLLPTRPTDTLPIADQLGAALASVGSGRAKVLLPRFHFSFGQELTSTLKALGVPTMFGTAADLGGIPADHTALRVSTVVQRTRVDVDEQGTTAAAATGVGAEPLAAPAQAPELAFDRPFVFLIRDTETGQVLFFGRVADPR